MSTEDYKIRGIPSAMIDRFWPFAEPYVKRALDHTAGEMGPDDLKRACREQEAQLFLVSQGARVVGAAISEVICYPRRKHLSCITLAGKNFSDWVDLMHNTMTTWAYDLGCDAIVCQVRKGLVPKMQEMGFKHLHSVVVRQLDRTKPDEASDVPDPAQEVEARNGL